MKVKVDERLKIFGVMKKIDNVKGASVDVKRMLHGGEIVLKKTYGSETRGLWKAMRHKFFDIEIDEVSTEYMQSEEGED